MADNKNNIIIRLTDRIERQEFASGLYGDLLRENNIREKEEARALDVTQPQINFYKDPHSDRSLPYGLALYSTVGDQLANVFARHRGGMFVKISEENLDNDTTQEKAEVLETISAMLKSDKREEAGMWKKIMEIATQGYEECRRRKS